MVGLDDIPRDVRFGTAGVTAGCDATGPSVRTGTAGAAGVTAGCDATGPSVRTSTAAGQHRVQSAFDGASAPTSVSPMEVVACLNSGTVPEKASHRAGLFE